MKGLLKNNFYGVIENLKIALAFVMLVGVLLLITGEATLLSAFSLIAPPIIALLMVSCVRKESASKWEKYKLTLPVRRKAIIESQYISHTIWSISGVVIVAVFMTLTVFIHGDQYFYYHISIRRRNTGYSNWSLFLSTLLFMGSRENRSHSDYKCDWFDRHSIRIYYVS